MDGLTFTLNGGVGQASVSATQAITLGQILTASVVPVRGAAGYAWYVGAVGAERLQIITNVATVTFSAPLNATNQLASALTAADYSANPNLAFDGLASAALNATSGAIWQPLTNGAILTTGGRGNVNEIDNLLLAMFNATQVSPSVLYVNAQQAKDIASRVLNGSSAPLLRYTNDDQGFAIVANGVIKSYFNPFALNGGREIPIKIHPKMPAGTILGYAEDLPAQYQSSEVPNVAAVKTRADYYELDWPMRTRREEVGVYAEEVLAVYAPFAIGVINNITAG